MQKQATKFAKLLPFFLSGSESNDTREHEEHGVATSLIDPVVTTKPKKKRTLRVELSDPAVRRAGLLDVFCLFPVENDFLT